MVGQSHLEMHVDHQHWLTELALWRDDIDLWRQEVGRARTDVERLETALREEDKALEEHARTLAQHVQALRSHEGELAAFEQGGADAKIIAMAKGHLEEESVQRHQREIHERIKKHHHVLMAHWSTLFKAMTAAL